MNPPFGLVRVLGNCSLKPTMKIIASHLVGGHSALSQWSRGPANDSGASDTTAVIIE